MRPDWVFGFNTACQRFVVSTFDVNAAAVAKVADDLRQAMPRPLGEMESVFLRARLLEIALRWIWDRHERLHPSSPHCRTATLVVAKSSERWVRDASICPIDTFTACVSDAAREFEIRHGQALARCAASYVQARMASSIDMEALATELAAHPSTIRRAFRREYGVSLRQFQRRLRVARAAEIMSAGADDKIESIARDVGWGSKRGLYHAWRQVKSGTPRSP